MSIQSPHVASVNKSPGHIREDPSWPGLCECVFPEGGKSGFVETSFPSLWLRTGLHLGCATQHMRT